MEPAIDVVRRLGGVCRTRDLREVGHYPRSIASAVASGAIERARIGHFVDPALHEQTKRAIRVGGRVACASAAIVHGLRVLEHPSALHVCVAPHDSRFRRARDGCGRVRPGRAPWLTLHWSEIGAAGPPLPPVATVLEQVLECLPPLDALCILDSAREAVPWANTRPRLDDIEFDVLLSRLSRRGFAIAARSSSMSQAVGETVARERLRLAGIIATPQAALPGGFFADLLIGERLVIECEGYAAHGDEDAFERDRQRKAFLRACGYVVLDFSHRQIVHDWPSVLGTIRSVLRRGQSLRETTWPGT
ncbi:endonuclease domain-containing protein [Agromyces salentinus]|nr:DUF559 domain-containing protein [Agromyces salentinus]